MPFLHTHLFGGIEANSIAPKVRNFADLELKLVVSRVSIHEVCIVDELKEKLIEVCFDVDALQSWIVVLIDKHVVRIYLKAPIFTGHDTNMVNFA